MSGIEFILAGMLPPPFCWLPSASWWWNAPGC